MSTMIILAGPHGAGKTTLYQNRVRSSFGGQVIDSEHILLEELGDARSTASRQAAELARRRIGALISRGDDFVTETAFSHPSSLDLVFEGRARGYSVWVLQVGLQSPEVAMARIAHRVENGGHHVPETKIRAQFHRSTPVIREAVRCATVGLVYDNSEAGHCPKLCLTFERGYLSVVRPGLPKWIEETYAADLST
jgi:predicted ABC-type ATPase